MIMLFNTYFFKKKQPNYVRMKYGNSRLICTSSEKEPL